MELILIGNHDDNNPHQHHHSPCSAPAASSSSSSSSPPISTPSPPSSPPLPISFGPGYNKYHFSSSSSTISPPPSPRHSSISSFQHNTLSSHRLSSHQQQNPSLDTAAPSLTLKSSTTSSFSLEQVPIIYPEAHINDPVRNTTGPHNIRASSSCFKDLLEWLLLKCCRHCHLSLR